MLEAWTRRRARKAAIAVIRPLLEQSRQRLHGIPSAAWADPYLTGFLVMLITGVARREGGLMAEGSLAAVQAGAWAELTGEGGDLIGTDLIWFGRSGDPDFARGCNDAILLMQQVWGSGAATMFDHRETYELVTRLMPAPPQLGIAPDELSVNASLPALWTECFESRVAALRAERPER